MHTTLLDTGPVVALLHGADRDQERCVDAIVESAGRGRIATIWEVVGEVYTFLRCHAGHRGALRSLEWVDTVECLPVEPGDRARTHDLLRRYRELPLSYVDALLLAVAERTRAEELLTLDAELTAVRLHPAPAITVVR